MTKKKREMWRKRRIRDNFSVKKLKGRSLNHRGFDYMTFPTEYPGAEGIVYFFHIDLNLSPLFSGAQERQELCLWCGSCRSIGHDLQLHYNLPPKPGSHHYCGSLKAICELQQGLTSVHNHTGLLQFHPGALPASALCLGEQTKIKHILKGINHWADSQNLQLWRFK